jgi:hypothetical protein
MLVPIYQTKRSQIPEDLKTSYSAVREPRERSRYSDWL